MAYHLTDHIYITQFRDEVILLDLKRDKYTVCFKEFSDLLMQLLEANSLSSPEKVLDSASTLSLENEDIQELLTDKIIESKDTSYPFYIDRKINSEGMDNIEWRLPLNNERAPFTIQVVKAFLTLLKVNFFIKVRGFYSTIQLIKRSRKNDEQYIVPTKDDLHGLANIVNKACLLYPTRTKCLEWAMTFVLLALKRKWKCNLEVGVQNYPFMAHAWVECDGKVVMDADGLRDGLAIILNEPFRRLKI